MATNNTQEELKRQAVENLSASRTEIVAEIHRLRLELSPKHVFHRLVGHHKGAVIGAVIATGAASGLLLLRHMRSSRLAPHAKPRMVVQSERSTTIGSRILRILAGSLLPALLKSTAASSLRDSWTRSKP